MRAYLLVALISALVTFATTWVSVRVARKLKLHREPRERDVHESPTPRIGGIGMYLGLLAGIVSAALLGWFEGLFLNPAQPIAVLVAAAIIVIVGLLDDLIDLDWTAKLAGQIFAAGVLVFQGIQILSLPIGGVTVGSYAVSVAISMFAVVVVMNAVNFIDGLDGLAAGVVGIATAAFFAYSYLLAQQTTPSNYFSLAGLLSAIVLGITVGFIPLNWRPAKIFMGDSGAMLLGLLMATSAITVTGSIDPATVTRSDLLPALLPLLLPIAILILPLLDLALAVLRRIRKGKSPFQADRSHLHHQLQDLGHGHRGTVLVFYHWTLLISVSLLLFFFLPAPLVVSIALAWTLLALCHTLWPILARRLKCPNANLRKVN